VTERRGRRCKHLLDDLKENKGHGKLKEKTLACICGELAFEEATDGRKTDNNEGTQ
jgi:hypothetical protein